MDTICQDVLQALQVSFMVDLEEDSESMKCKPGYRKQKTQWLKRYFIKRTCRHSDKDHFIRVVSGIQESLHDQPKAT